MSTNDLQEPRKSTEYIIKVSTLQVVTENICSYNGKKSICDTAFKVPPDNDIWAVCGAIFIGTRESMNRLNWCKYYVTLGIIKGKRRRFGIIQKLCYKMLLLNGRREGTHGPGALPLREFKWIHKSWQVKNWKIWKLIIEKEQDENE